jgi:hypothetical protein
MTFKQTTHFAVLLSLLEMRAKEGAAFRDRSYVRHIGLHPLAFPACGGNCVLSVKANIQDGWLEL